MSRRRHTRQIRVGSVPIGGDAPVSVQSMTNTPTRDVEATLNQIRALARLGCQIVRVAVNDEEAAAALPAILQETPVPLIADIHFNHRLALAALEAGVHGLRINPGNIGSRSKVERVVREAKRHGVPIRIGVNAGSVEKSLRHSYEQGALSLPQAMVQSALHHIRILEELDFRDIKVSLKASDVITTVEAYRRLANKCEYPFHVGVTEAGTVRTGAIKSAAGIGILLMDGLCDTIRVSLTGPPEEEVPVARNILRIMGERDDEPVLISCPTCGRTSIDVTTLADEVERMIEPIREPIQVAVMGCEVNGPGEAREADIGVSGGSGEGVIFRKGRVVRRTSESEILTAFREELDKLLEDRKNNRDAAAGA